MSLKRKQITKLLVDMYRAGFNLSSYHAEFYDSRINNSIGEDKPYKSFREAREEAVKQLKLRGITYVPSTKRKPRKSQNPVTDLGPRGISITSDTKYNPDQLPALNLTRTSFGYQIIAKILKNENWLSSYMLSERLNISEKDIKDSFPEKFPHLCLTYRIGNSRFYFFPTKILEAYQFDDSPEIKDPSVKKIPEYFESDENSEQRLLQRYPYLKKHDLQNRCRHLVKVVEILDDTMVNHIRNVNNFDLFDRNNISSIDEFISLLLENSENAVNIYEYVVSAYKLKPEQIPEQFKPEKLSKPQNLEEVVAKTDSIF